MGSVNDHIAGAVADGDSINDKLAAFFAGITFANGVMGFDAIKVSKPSGTDVVFEVFIDNETFPRWRLLANGTMQHGDGTVAPDTDFLRSGASELQLKDTLRFDRSSAATKTIFSRVTNDVNSRYSQRVDGMLQWGDGNQPEDTNVYREAPNVLATDDKLHVVQELEVDGAINHDGTTAGFYGLPPVVQANAIANPTAGAIIDLEARAAINSMLTVLRNLGWINT